MANELLLLGLEPERRVGVDDERYLVFVMSADDRDTAAWTLAHAGWCQGHEQAFDEVKDELRPRQGDSCAHHHGVLTMNLDRGSAREWRPTFAPQWKEVA